MASVAAPTPESKSDKDQVILDGPNNGNESLAEPPIKLDIEHTIVVDDPRKWSKSRKVRSPDALAHTARL